MERNPADGKAPACRGSSKQPSQTPGGFLGTREQTLTWCEQAQLHRPQQHYVDLHQLVFNGMDMSRDESEKEQQSGSLWPEGSVCKPASEITNSAVQPKQDSQMTVPCAHLLFLEACSKTASHGPPGLLPPRLSLAWEILSGFSTKLPAKAEP